MITKKSKVNRNQFSIVKRSSNDSNHLDSYIIWTMLAITTSVISIKQIDPIFQSHLTTKNNPSLTATENQNQSMTWLEFLVVTPSDTQVKSPNTEQQKNLKFYYSVNSYKLSQLAKQSNNQQIKTRLYDLSKEYQKLAVASKK